MGGEDDCFDTARGIACNFLKLRIKESAAIESAARRAARMIYLIQCVWKRDSFQKFGIEETAATE